MGGGAPGSPSLTVAEHVHNIYEKAWQPAVKIAGGTVWLAAAMERSHPGISKRVRHVPDDKGDLQTSTLDMLGHICIDDPEDEEKRNEKARATFLAGICDVMGYEMPKKKKRQRTADEKAAESKQELLKFGEKGREAVVRIFGEDDQ